MQLIQKECRGHGNTSQRQQHRPRHRMNHPGGPSLARDAAANRFQSPSAKRCSLTKAKALPGGASSSLSCSRSPSSRNPPAATPGGSRKGSPPALSLPVPPGTRGLGRKRQRLPPPAGEKRVIPTGRRRGWKRQIRQRCPSPPSRPGAPRPAAGERGRPWAGSARPLFAQGRARRSGAPRAELSRATHIVLVGDAPFLHVQHLHLRDAPPGHASAPRSPAPAAKRGAAEAQGEALAQAAGTGACSAAPSPAEPSRPPAAGGGRRPRPAPAYPGRRGGPATASLKGRPAPPAPRVSASRAAADKGCPAPRSPHPTMEGEGASAVPRGGQSFGEGAAVCLLFQGGGCGAGEDLGLHIFLGIRGLCLGSLIRLLTLVP